MKKFIFLLCGFLLLTLSSCTEQTNLSADKSSIIAFMTESEQTYTDGVYELAIFSELINNDSVGNDWKEEYSCEGSVISSGNRWTIPLDTTKAVKIKATITEFDDWPDTESAFISVVLKDGFETYSTITVTENKGRYTGNTANWKITCAVKLIEKITTP